MFTRTAKTGSLAKNAILPLLVVQRGEALDSFEAKKPGTFVVLTTGVAVSINGVAGSTTRAIGSAPFFNFLFFIGGASVTWTFNSSAGTLTRGLARRWP
jgi:hypothetical protein